MDIIEEVVGESTEWLSETVLVPKEGTKEERMCTDMKAANRERGMIALYRKYHLHSKKKIWKFKVKFI